MSTEQEELELRAYLALQGASGAAGKPGDWRVDVASALRSEAPLSREFRDALASYIDGGRFGFRLELLAEGREKKRRQDWFGGMLVRREWMEVGAWIQAKIAGGSSRAEALQAAAETHHASPEKCDKALIYFDRVQRWVSQVEKSGGVDQFPTGRSGLIDFFHAKDASGQPLDAPEHNSPQME